MRSSVRPTFSWRSRGPWTRTIGLAGSLLTGSANVMTLPRLADSLAVRIETPRLLPLAHAEIAGTRPTSLDRLFAGELQGTGQAAVGDDLVRIVLAGGFAEALAGASERRT